MNDNTVFCILISVISIVAGMGWIVTVICNTIKECKHKSDEDEQ